MQENAYDAPDGRYRRQYNTDIGKRDLDVLRRQMRSTTQIGDQKRQWQDAQQIGEDGAAYLDQRNGPYGGDQHEQQQVQSNIASPHDPIDTDHQAEQAGGIKGARDIRLEFQLCHKGAGLGYAIQPEFDQQRIKPGQ